jgi:hypothetical protein
VLRYLIATILTPGMFHDIGGNTKISSMNNLNIVHIYISTIMKKITNSYNFKRLTENNVIITTQCK